jgi:hypothetical protein
MKYIFSVIKKELGNLFLIAISLVLACIIFPIGIAWALIIKPIYHALKKDPSYAGKKMLKYFGNFFYQIFAAIKLLFRFIAEFIDLLGNAVSGELIEDAVTPMEDTMFGEGDVYISAALGDIEEKAKKDPSKITPTGRWINRQLNKFESNHSNKALRLHNFRQKLKAEK